MKGENVERCPVVVFPDELHSHECGGSLQSTTEEYRDRLVLDSTGDVIHDGKGVDSGDSRIYCENDHTHEQIRAALRPVRRGAEIWSRLDTVEIQLMEGERERAGMIRDGRESRAAMEASLDYHRERLDAQSIRIQRLEHEREQQAKATAIRILREEMPESDRD